MAELWQVGIGTQWSQRKLPKARNRLERFGSKYWTSQSERRKSSESARRKIENFNLKWTTEKGLQNKERKFGQNPIGTPLGKDKVEIVAGCSKVIGRKANVHPIPFEQKGLGTYQRAWRIQSTQVECRE